MVYCIFCCSIDYRYLSIMKDDLVGGAIKVHSSRGSGR